MCSMCVAALSVLSLVMVLVLAGVWVEGGVYGGRQGNSIERHASPSAEFPGHAKQPPWRVEDSRRDWSALMQEHSLLDRWINEQNAYFHHLAASSGDLLRVRRIHGRLAAIYRLWFAAVQPPCIIPCICVRVVVVEGGQVKAHPCYVFAATFGKSIILLRPCRTYPILPNPSYSLLNQNTSFSVCCACRRRPQLYKTNSNQTNRPYYSVHS